MIGTITHSVKAAVRLDPEGERMQAHEARAEQRIAAALDQLRRDVTRGMTADNVPFMMTRFSQRDVLQPFTDAVIAALREIAIDGGAWGREQVERAVFGVTKFLDINWELVNTAAEAWARSYGYNLVRGIMDTTRTRLQKEISEWTRNDETVNQLAQRLAEPSGPFSIERAKRIAVTETTRAFAEGNRAAWRESKVIQRRRWNTNTDERVCPLCGPLHNEVVGINEEFSDGSDGPPRHVSCRCWVTPVVEEAEDLTTGLGQFGL